MLRSLASNGLYDEGMIDDRKRPPVDDRFRDDRDGMDAGVRDRLRIGSDWRAITPYGGQRGIDSVPDREVTEATASRAVSTTIRSGSNRSRQAAPSNPSAAYSPAGT